MRDFEAVAYVTAHYPHLQGLRIIPFGLLFLAAALWHAGLLPWPAAHDRAVGRWFFAGVAAAALAGTVVGRRYRARYGTVRLRLIDRASPVLLAISAGAMTLVWQQLVADWPVPVPVVFIGAVLVWVGAVSGGIRRHYVVIGCAWLLFPTIGSIGIPGDGRRLLLDLLIGASVIAAGIGDHLILRELLAPPADTDGSAV